MLLQNMNIDYELLHKAVLYYEALRYKQIEVPWIVSEEASLFTAPTKDCVYVTDRNEHLIGSAEQGFIHLLKHNPEKIKNDNYYFAISPCFRRDKLDEIHSNSFIKLELFCYPKYENIINVKNDFIRDAKRVFQALSMKEIQTVTSQYGTGTDLEYKGIELGSYGIRKFYEDMYFVYGTGLALPRFQLIMKPESSLNVNVP